MQFLQKGDRFIPVADVDAPKIQKLPAGTYLINAAMAIGHFVERIDAPELPARIYGNANKHADRILNTFINRNSSTGALLTGEKGSGKTMTARLIAKNAIAKGMPVLVLNNPELVDDGLFRFLQSINQPSIVMVDEFEKLFPGSSQQPLLTLLDGVFSSPKLWLLTCNNYYMVDTNLRNRPGRLFYCITYEGLSEAEIKEYAEANLDEGGKKHIPVLCKMRNLFGTLTFDMLKALIEEMNRYAENPVEAMSLLNLNHRTEGHNEYNITILKDNKPLEHVKFCDPSKWLGSPFIINSRESNSDPYRRITFSYATEIDANKKPTRYEAEDLRLEPQHLIEADTENGTFTYRVDDWSIRLSRHNYKPDNYAALLA